jgi:predicted transcriptional regulator
VTTGTTTVRISKRARANAEAVAAATNRSMSNVIEEAVDAYRREIFWRHYEEGIGRLRQDPEAWADYVGEREAEAGALRDGLEPE